VTDCRRFETEGLLALQQGRPLDEHFRTCADCRTALAAHERLQRELSSLEPHEPRAGWEGRVWAQIDRPVPTRARTPWRPLAVASLAAAATIVLLLRSAVPPVSSPGLVIQVEEGQGRRGASAPLLPTPALRSVESLTGPLPLGSRLVVSASTGTARFAELRVYRNEADLIVQTTLSAGCAEPRDVRVVLLLDAVGRYRTALLTSNHSLPAPAGSVDADYATRPAGVEMVVAAEVGVR
jgi:hypothetical protein